MDSKHLSNAAKRRLRKQNHEGNLQIEAKLCLRRKRIIEDYPNKLRMVGAKVKVKVKDANYLDKMSVKPVMLAYLGIVDWVRLQVCSIHWYCIPYNPLFSKMDAIHDMKTMQTRASEHQEPILFQQPISAVYDFSRFNAIEVKSKFHKLLFSIERWSPIALRIPRIGSLFGLKFSHSKFVLAAFNTLLRMRSLKHLHVDFLYPTLCSFTNLDALTVNSIQFGYDFPPNLTSLTILSWTHGVDFERDAFQKLTHLSVKILATTSNEHWKAILGITTLISIEHLLDNIPDELLVGIMLPSLRHLRIGAPDKLPLVLAAAPFITHLRAKTHWFNDPNYTVSYNAVTSLKCLVHLEIEQVRTLGNMMCVQGDYDWSVFASSLVRLCLIDVVDWNCTVLDLHLTALSRLTHLSLSYSRSDLTEQEKANSIACPKVKLNDVIISGSPQLRLNQLELLGLHPLYTHKKLPRLVLDCMHTTANTDSRVAADTSD